MENRNIESNMSNLDGALETYSYKISRLRREALVVANNFLEKPPHYWGSNSDEARDALKKLVTIEQSGRSLEAELGAHFPDCNE
jgi:hypothetical protein